ncbi:hypothetical protein Tsubulata_003515 [Turnera subulata]|uniref:F-box domain-containing protein n=1 Tax=Turnera subulata TaxID=218843 RepID=A0A9Q0G4B6_9ROSI|nr:hypothetical protein Tsubulata_003515 [Turnera subulata]
MGNPKKKKLNRGAKRNGEDRISDLPDDIIHRILSLLDDTKFAAQTCVLSKRWKNVWTSLPDLRFSTAYYKTRRSFRKFLLSALLRRDRNCEVRSLHLSIGFGCVCADYDSDEETDMDDDSDDEGYNYADALCAVGPQGLPYLENSKPLHIYSLIGGGDMEISGTKLVTFKMEGVEFDKVKLSAPNLEDFQYLDREDGDYWGRLGDFFEIDLPSLQTAQVVVDYQFYDESEQVEDKLMKLLYGIRNAKSLRLNVPPLELKSNIFVEDAEAETKLPSKVPQEIKTYLLSGSPHPQDVDVIIEEDDSHGSYFSLM